MSHAPGTYPVTATFLDKIRAAAWTAPDAIAWSGLTVRPVINEAGVWNLGLGVGITMSSAAFAELAAPGVVANADGSFTNAAGALRVLVLTDAGACEPSDPPSPPTP